MGVPEVSYVLIWNKHGMEIVTDPTHIKQRRSKKYTCTHQAQDFGKIEGDIDINGRVNVSDGAGMSVVVVQQIAEQSVFIVHRVWRQSKEHATHITNYHDNRVYNVAICDVMVNNVKMKIKNPKMIMG